MMMSMLITLCHQILISYIKLKEKSKSLFSKVEIKQFAGNFLDRHMSSVD